MFSESSSLAQPVAVASVALAIVFVHAAAPRVDPTDASPHADGPPAAHTGGFGEPTCQVCHADFEINEPTGTLGVDGLPARYEPGAIYEVSVILRGEGMERSGFQGAFRFATGEQRGHQAGQPTPLGATVEVRSDGGIDYVQHSRGGSATSAEDTTIWRFRWRAPTGSDPVTFHVAANNGNGDDSPFGDFIYTTEASMVGASQ